MARHLILALPLLLLAACADEPSAEEQERIDAAAVAAVEAANAQEPPLEELAPEILTDADMADAGVEGAHCIFMPGTNAGPRLIARSLDGFIKLDGEVLRLAADTGSLQLPGGIRTVYNGRSVVVRLTLAADQGTMAIEDSYGREVYNGAGPVTCEDGARAPDNPEQADL